MANHKSAEKRARQSTKKNSVNSKRKSTAKSAEKSLMKALAEKKLAELQTLLGKYSSQIMKVAAKGALKKETASRKISRLSKQVHNLISSVSGK